MPLVPLARRAARLSASLPPAAPAGAIAFDSGHASPAVLPDLGVEAARSLSERRAETLQYAPRTGLPELRDWIAGYLNEDGVAVSGEQILVTNGAKQAIELVCRMLLDEGDAIVVTAPTYFSAIPIFRSFGAGFIEVGQDREGLDVDQLAALLALLDAEGRPRPKFLYDVPDFHNPTGLTMFPARRAALLELAAKYEFLIVEDSPYRQVRFEGRSVPSLKALDQDDRVVQVGTFSKLMAPGLRVGWAAAPSPLIARMAQLKADGGSCPLTQRLILEFCAAGRLRAHTERFRLVYRANRDRMVAAVRRELPEASMVVPEGGYYLWLTLPTGVDGEALAQCAAEAGVIVLPGSRFFAGARAGRLDNHVRLAFSHSAGDEIDEGVQRLAAGFKALDAAPAVPAER